MKTFKFKKILLIAVLFSAGLVAGCGMGPTHVALKELAIKTCIDNGGVPIPSFWETGAIVDCKIPAETSN